MGAPAPARLVYEHGGMIYAIAADGSGRRALVRGDSPAFSPSGDALAFSRSSGENRASIWVAAPDGSGARRLVSGAGAAYAPAWSPDGSRLAFARGVVSENGIASTIEVIARDGSAPRAIVRLRGPALASVDAPVWSPDGQRVLYTRTRPARDRYTFEIRSVAASGGDDALFLPEAYDGAFSPDGTRFAFADTRDARGSTCGSDECYPNGDLAVAGADGSGRRALLRTEAAEGNVSWSPDGTRIAFASGRNTPETDGGEPEVYTVAPDGSCLTWLTNGAPGSAAPAWVPGAGAAAPPSCGAIGLRPLVETALPRRAGGAWWAGRQLGTALLSDTLGHGRATSFFYTDCSAFEARDCLPLFIVLQQDSCERRGALSLQLRSLRHPRRVRGGAILTDSHRDYRGLVLTGRSALRLQLLTNARPARERALYTRVVAALRPFRGRAVSRLPAPVLPRALVRLLPPRLRAGVKPCQSAASA